MGMITSITTIDKQTSNKTIDQQRTEKLGDDFRCGMADRILDGSLQVYEYLTTLLNAFHGGSEVVIEKNHIGSFLGHVRTWYVHSNAEVRTFQSRGVVNTITSPATPY
jgi:hypothetical protein